RSRSLVWANVVIMLLGAAMFAMWFFLSLYMQNVLGYSPLTAGLAFLPQTAAIVVGAQISSRLVTRIGPRPLLVVASLIAAGSIGRAALATIGVDRTNGVLAASHGARSVLPTAMTDGFSRAFSASVFVFVAAALAASMIPPVASRRRRRLESEVGPVPAAALV